MNPKPTSLFVALCILCVFRSNAQTWTLNSAPRGQFDGFSSVACSADGATVLVVQSAQAITTNAIYVSTNSGSTWLTNDLPGRYWEAAGCSGDGKVLVVMSSEGIVYSSTNSGTTWRSNNVPGTCWGWVAGSSDGARWIASASVFENHAPIYVSHDFGVTWSPTSAPTNYWIQVAASANGNTLIAAGSLGLCVSTNGGAAWTLANSNQFPSCACSADGKVIFALGYYGVMDISTNSGVSWVPRSVPQSVTYAVVSADGRRIAGVSDGLQLSVLLSDDFGVTWHTNGALAQYWGGIASSADGNRLFVTGGDGLYTLARTTPSRITTEVSNGNLRLSWLIPSMPVTLQQNSNLATTSWSDVAIQPEINLMFLKQEVTFTPVAGQKFYRLVR